jgi:hypothetical protein
VDFLGKDSLNAPLIVSVANQTGRAEFRTLIYSKEGIIRFMIPACKDKEIIDKVKQCMPSTVDLVKLYSPKYFILIYI